MGGGSGAAAGVAAAPGQQAKGFNWQINKTLVSYKRAAAPCSSLNLAWDSLLCLPRNCWEWLEVEFCLAKLTRYSYVSTIPGQLRTITP